MNRDAERHDNSFPLRGPAGAENRRAQLVVVECDIRLDGNILQEFRFGALVILLATMSDAQIEVDEGELRLRLRGGF